MGFSGDGRSPIQYQTRGTLSMTASTPRRRGLSPAVAASKATGMPPPPAQMVMKPSLSNTCPGDHRMLSLSGTLRVSLSMMSGRKLLLDLLSLWSQCQKLSCISDSGLASNRKHALMAAISTIFVGLGDATTLRYPCSPSCLKVNPFSSSSLYHNAEICT
jgi:hypothetical protein